MQVLFIINIADDVMNTVTTADKLNNGFIFILN